LQQLLAFISVCETQYSNACSVSCNQRYLMTRLSLQVVYLWRHVSSTVPPFILWWSNFEIIFGPLHRSSPFIGELRCQAIQMEHGPYIAERTQIAYCEMSVPVTEKLIWFPRTFRPWFSHSDSICTRHANARVLPVLGSFTRIEFACKTLILGENTIKICKCVAAILYSTV
jgi:hypothetical protein